MSALSRTGTFFCLSLFFSFEFLARFTALSIVMPRCLRVIGLPEPDSVQQDLRHSPAASCLHLNEGPMQTKELCVYNETRENFMSSRVTVIDSKSDPLKGIKALIEGLGPHAEAGLWLNPLKSVPTVPTMSPYDLVYLDQDCRVVHSVAMIPDDEVPHFSGHATSALLLPIHTFSKSQAHPGDQVIICAAEEIERRPARVQLVPVPVAVAAIPSPAPQILRPVAKPSSSSPHPVIHPPLLIEGSSQSQTAMPQFEAIDQVQSPVRKKESSSIRFLRGIVHLRVHISFSIAPLPASRTTGSQPARSNLKLPTQSTGKSPMNTAAQWTRNSCARWTEKWPTQLASFKSRFLSWSEEFTQKRIRPSIATVIAFSAKSTRFCARRYEFCKLSYLHWADEFMHGSARITSRPSSAEAKRPAIHARGRQWLKARFLR